MTSRGSSKTFGGDSWRVYIRKGPSSLAPVVFDLNNGLYEVLFLVLEPGSYTAQVWLDYTLCDGVREPPDDWFIKGKNCCVLVSCEILNLKTLISITITNINPRTSKRSGGGGDQMDPPIGFSDLKFEAFKQSK